MAGQNPRFGGGALRARRTGGQAELRGTRARAGDGGGGVAHPGAVTALLLLLQPGILLYDRMVMEGAAAEACRLLATKTAAQGDMDGSCEAYVRRRLGAVPPHDCFHVHPEAARGTSASRATKRSQTVRVSIATEVRPLPLLDTGASLLGMT